MLDFNDRNNIHVLLRKENSFSKKQKSAKRSVNMVADFFVQRIFLSVDIAGKKRKIIARY